jgi:hypothetical protein
MSLLRKIKEFVMPSASEMFDAYVKYFREKGKTIKVGRGIRIIYGNITEEYGNWIELNEVYKLFPTLTDKVDSMIQPILLERGWHLSSNMFNDVVVVGREGKKVAIYQNKFDLAYDLGLTDFKTPKDYIKCGEIYRSYRIYAYGSEEYANYIADKFNEITGSTSFEPKMFRNPDRIYFINSWGHLCSTKDDMVIDIIENDVCWINIVTDERKENIL